MHWNNGRFYGPVTIESLYITDYKYNALTIESNTLTIGDSRINSLIKGNKIDINSNSDINLFTSNGNGSFNVSKKMDIVSNGNMTLESTAGTGSFKSNDDMYIESGGTGTFSSNGNMSIQSTSGTGTFKSLNNVTIQSTSGTGSFTSLNAMTIESTSGTGTFKSNDDMTIQSTNGQITEYAKGLIRISSQDNVGIYAGYNDTNAISGTAKTMKILSTGNMTLGSTAGTGSFSSNGNMTLKSNGTGTFESLNDMTIKSTGDSNRVYVQSKGLAQIKSSESYLRLYGGKGIILKDSDSGSSVTSYGTTLPTSNNETGKIFFKLIS